jgi:hypothetical protein
LGTLVVATARIICVPDVRRRRREGQSHLRAVFCYTTFLGCRTNHVAAALRYIPHSQITQILLDVDKEEERDVALLAQLDKVRGFLGRVREQDAVVGDLRSVGGA